MIVIAMHAKHPVTYLMHSVASALAFADSIIIVAGQNTYGIVGKVQENYPGKITIIWSGACDSYKALHDAYNMMPNGDYFFRLGISEVIPEEFKTEFCATLIESIDKFLPITARTLYFWKDFRHTIRSDELDKYILRGCLVDHKKGLNLNPTESIQLRNKIYSYSFVYKLAKIDKFRGKQPNVFLPIS